MKSSLLKIIFIIFIIINILTFIFLEPPDKDIEDKHPYYALYTNYSHILSFLLLVVLSIYMAVREKKLIFILSASFLFVIVSHYFSSKRKALIDKKTFLLFWLGWIILIAGLL